MVILREASFRLQRPVCACPGEFAISIKSSGEPVEWVHPKAFSYMLP
jgi:hypothetical protein